MIRQARVVSIRFSRAEYAALAAEAAAADAPISAWLRLRMLDAQDARDRLAGIEARLAALAEALVNKPSLDQMDKFLNVYRSAAQVAAAKAREEAKAKAKAEAAVAGGVK